ncbi:hypothetical protein PUN28_018215 [Cardiocondyla obscurior]|uniref:Peptidase S1 domain-containing protein n=1 Tax=Cardiocondyla obscurior TaxID=286306 RepID=A0AAW2EK89_9HYME
MLLAAVYTRVYSDEPEKLVNGTPTSIEKYPHAVSLRMNNNHFCGGSLIGEQWVLTAGHCVVPVLENSRMRASVTVVSGTTYLDKDGESHKVDKLWYHDNYNPRALGRGPYDIGLIKLAAPVTFSETQKAISLPTNNIEKDDSVTIAAWGSTGFQKHIHNDLQKLDAKAMLPKTCQEYYFGLLMKIHDNEFCTLISRGTGLCNGDSGSGLIKNSDGTIIGLVSGGKPCARGSPDIYTNVFPYLSWIKEKMES